MDCEFVERLLKLSAYYDLELFWHSDLQFFINCSDLFLWAYAEAEPVTPDNIDVLELACKDASDNGGELFCCRMRKMRPQGSYYEALYPGNWALFDACGPVREVGPGNPVPRPGPTP